MKKFALLILIVIGSVGIKANPITLPPVISEIYFNGTNVWSIELVGNSIFQGFLWPSDSLAIISNEDTAFFKCKLRLDTANIYIITADSLVTPCFINPMTDRIGVYLFDNSGYSEIGDYNFSWGNNNINGPKSGQSIKRVMFSNPVSGNISFLTLDNVPSLGSNPFSANHNATFSGYIFDANHTPIHYAAVYLSPVNNQNTYTSTDLTGFFNLNQIYAYNYYAQISIGNFHFDSLITIEPDTINYFEFTLDTLISNANINDLKKTIKINCYPNPASSGSTVNIELPNTNKFNTGVVKIYNSNGEIIKILPLNLNENSCNYKLKWNGTSREKHIPTGEYICILELDGNKITSTKMVMIK